VTTLAQDFSGWTITRLSRRCDYLRYTNIFIEIEKLGHAVKETSD